MNATYISLKKTIVDLFELDKMPPKEAEKMLPIISKIIFQRVLMRLLPELSEEDLSKYNEIVDAEANSEMLLTFLNEKIPNFGNIFTEETEGLYVEYIEKIKSNESSNVSKNDTVSKSKGCLIIFMTILLSLYFFIITYIFYI